MAQPNPILTARYDDLADVLYVSTKREKNVEFEPDQDGLVWRFSGTDGSPLGVTVMDYLETWWPRKDELASRISAQLKVSLRDAMKAMKPPEDPKEIAARRDAALLRMLKTAPKKHVDQPAKSRRRPPTTRGEPKP